jgi:hypothetical protein
MSCFTRPAFTRPAHPAGSVTPLAHGLRMWTR